jgi:hypothetical protein
MVFLFMCLQPHISPRSIPAASHREIPRPIISPANPLESTLPKRLGSVLSKPPTDTHFPLESTLTKKPQGEGSVMVNFKFDQEFVSRATLGSEGLLRISYEEICPDERGEEGPLFTPQEACFSRGVSRRAISPRLRQSCASREVLEPCSSCLSTLREQLRLAEKRSMYGHAHDSI